MAERAPGRNIVQKRRPPEIQAAPPRDLKGAPAGPNGREGPKAQHSARKGPPRDSGGAPRDLKGAPGGFGMQGPGATGAPGADRATPKVRLPSVREAQTPQI